jgi:hypothetical protein
VAQLNKDFPVADKRARETWLRHASAVHFDATQGLIYVLEGGFIVTRDLQGVVINYFGGPAGYHAYNPPKLEQDGSYSDGAARVRPVLPGDEAAFGDDDTLAWPHDITAFHVQGRGSVVVVAEVNGARISQFSYV